MESSVATTIAAAAPTARTTAVTGLPAAGKKTKIVSLNGAWLFRTDPMGIGEAERWPEAISGARDWAEVSVPHTWQIEAPNAEYRGVAWYSRKFESPPELNSSTVRLQFEAVFHSAKVWVNGKLAGEHARKGYSAFDYDVTPLLNREGLNTVTVRVDNAFNDHMLPRGRSSDWAHDGGIYRPVELLITPQLFVNQVDVEALPERGGAAAAINIVAYVQNQTKSAQNVTLSYRIVDRASGLSVMSKDAATLANMAPNSSAELRTAGVMAEPKLWHFDSPNLYQMEATAKAGELEHTFSTTFGVRRFEVRGTAFYLNDERVKLMGVERMAGSNPEFGMAEPAEWMAHDHEDLKHLNCVFTRVHWPQDKRVLDYCDERGILIQTEVPTWGPDTFKGMGEQPDGDIMENGIEQLREMISRDRNHPCIGSWGLCNEIGGQNPPAYNFAKKMLAEAKKLDPNRLCSYASHSLFKTPGKDVSGLMDFVSCNEYFGSWQKGGAADLAEMIDGVHAAFPDKPIVVSEYGYCACTADRPEGDQHRTYVLRSQDEVFRQRDYIAGLIFFCYNDYRTHVGDRGLGVMKQRVHGVVDIYGSRKASYEMLRRESSPIESLEVEGSLSKFEVTVRTRKQLPVYVVRKYRLRAVLYGYGNIPVEKQDVSVPDLQPGDSARLTFSFAESTPLRVELEVIRPTGFSAFQQTWSA